MRTTILSWTLLFAFLTTGCSPSTPTPNEPKPLPGKRIPPGAGPGDKR